MTVMRKTSYPGFTIVELLVVIIVIAILAAISIVTYAGMQGRAHDASVQTDLRHFAQNWSIYGVFDDLVGVSSEAVRDKISTFEWKASRGAYDTTNRNLVLCLNHNANSVMNPVWGTDGSNRRNWALVALSRSGNIFYVSSEQSTPVQYTGSVPMVFDNTELVCGVVISELGAPGFTSVYHGYMASDAVTGPWRSWTQ